MADEKISAMPDIGVLVGTERVPVVRTPSDGNNYTVAVAALAVIAGGVGLQPLPADTRSAPQTIALPPGNPALLPIVFDQYGNATAHNITITGAAFSLGINMNYGSLPFFWTGSAWFPF